MSESDGSSLQEYFIDDEKPKPGFQLRRLIPNFLTLCGLAAGMLAIQKAVGRLGCGRAVDRLCGGH